MRANPRELHTPLNVTVASVYFQAETTSPSELVRQNGIGAERILTPNHHEGRMKLAASSKATSKPEREPIPEHAPNRADPKATLEPSGQPETTPSRNNWTNDKTKETGALLENV